MNQQDLISETMRLEIAVVDALASVGCLHKYSDKTGPVQVEVPPEAAHFDPDSGLIWVELSSQRLPRPFTCHSLVKSEFKKAIADRFGHPVEVQHRDQMLFIISRVDVRLEIQTSQPHDMPQAV